VLQEFSRAEAKEAGPGDIEQRPEVQYAVLDGRAGHQQGEVPLLSLGGPGDHCRRILDAQ
jgi:hypothetical protein